jgi:hypothetical protein
MCNKGRLARQISPCLSVRRYLDMKLAKSALSPAPVLAGKDSICDDDNAAPERDNRKRDTSLCTIPSFRRYYFV